MARRWAVIIVFRSESSGRPTVRRRRWAGDPAVRNSGGVHIFGHCDQGCSERARPKASPGEDGGVSGSGAVYLFQGEATCATPERLNATRPGDSDAFGFFVSSSVDGLAVGTPYEDSATTGVNGDEDEAASRTAGAVHLFQ